MAVFACIVSTIRAHQIDEYWTIYRRQDNTCRPTRQWYHSTLLRRATLLASQLRKTGANGTP
eukprot:scaffold1112_cov92-Amphora_coffeaeformis.AAC.27